MRQKDGVVWIWQAVCQCPATLPCCSRLCFLAAENTIRQSDLCAACQTAKTEYRNYSARDSILYSKDILANVFIYPLVDMIYSSIYLIYLVMVFITYPVLLMNERNLHEILRNTVLPHDYHIFRPPTHVTGISYDTYEKGAAFREGQSSDWSSGMRRSRYCEENEVDTAPKPRAHNCRYREEKRRTRAKIT
ncbi:hypothetical protein G5I_03386 [Acromyrmex echinatior]|uniref:Uncharacterized protein n=1 Tax=Acromyrmex echinatior TaxID=103372 RepID=F4WCV3_ACREC|nr:hypothetical protein G5I_03386 [Acromyrmex echinatior]